MMGRIVRRQSGRDPATELDDQRVPPCLVAADLFFSRLGADFFTETAEHVLYDTRHCCVGCRPVLVEELGHLSSAPAVASDREVSGHDAPPLVIGVARGDNDYHALADRDSAGRENPEAVDQLDCDVPRQLLQQSVQSAGVLADVGPLCGGQVCPAGDSTGAAACSTK